MNYSKITFLVGLFVLSSLTCLIILAFKVSGLTNVFNNDTYKVYGYFDNIGSLKLRAPIKIGGVLIGRVSDITIDKEKYVPKVEMEISSDYKMLSSESKASILTSGLIGEQYIGITPGFYDEDMGTTYLDDGDFIKDTGSAIVLEELIGKFLYSTQSKDSQDNK